MNPVSLENIIVKWQPEIQHFASNVPFVLVGNKADLRQDADSVDKLRRYDEKPVSAEYATSVAKKLGAVAYMENSALRGEGIHSPCLFLMVLSCHSPCMLVGVKEVFDAAVKAALFGKSRKIKASKKEKAVPQPPALPKQPSAPWITIETSKVPEPTCNSFSYLDSIPVCRALEDCT